MIPSMVGEIKLDSLEKERIICYEQSLYTKQCEFFMVPSLKNKKLELTPQ